MKKANDVLREASRRGYTGTPAYAEAVRQRDSVRDRQTRTGRDRLSALYKTLGLKI